MKKRRLLSLTLCLALCVSLCAAHAAPTEKWESVKKQCEELGLQVTWYPEYEGLMRRYGTGNMLLVEGGKSYLCKLNSAARLAGPFDAFGEFNADGLAPACQNGKWGMVDRNGKAGVDFLYDTQAQAEAAEDLAPAIQESVDEDAFHEGLCRVQNQETGLWGFWDETGEKTVIPALFDAVGYFDYGYAVVLVDGVFGLLRNPRLNVGGAVASDKEITFTDVPAGSWFEKGVLTCARNGIMVGAGENTFSPNATLTDAECLMLAYRIYDQALGGDGAVMKMPEEYGYIRISASDGSSVREGYAGDRDLWEVQNISYSAAGLRLCLRGMYQAGPRGPATLTFGGKEYRGELKGVSMDRYGMRDYLVFEPEDAALNSMLSDAYFDMAPPARWWADLLYTIKERGLGEWDDVFSGATLLFGDEESRGGFARLLGAVTDLPKRFDVPPIPDGGDDHVYKLYGAGIIGGVDAYGTFDAAKTLTRAEAAVMVARVLDESQRLAAPHKPMPAEGEGYTLTYLRDGIFASWYMQDTYPYCVVGDFGEGGFTAFPVGLLTLEGQYAPWSDALRQEKEKDVKALYGWRNWGGLDTESGGGRYYRWSDGTPATGRFDWCGKIGPDGRGFVQKDGKLYRIQFDRNAEKAVVRPERPTVPTDAAEGTEYLYDFNFYDRYDAKVEQDFTLTGWDEERETAINYTLLMPVEGALEGAVAESVDGDGLTPYQLKRYKQESLDGTLVLGVHSYPLDGMEYISYLWTDRPGIVTDKSVGVGSDEDDVVWRYSEDLRLIKKDEAELNWMSSHSTWDFDELYVWQPFTPENNDCRDITFYMKDRKVAAIEMTEPFELRYVYGHDAEEEQRRAVERRENY